MNEPRVARRRIRNAFNSRDFGSDFIEERFWHLNVPEGFKF